MIPRVLLESSGDVDIVDIVVQRRDGPRRPRDHDDDDDDGLRAAALRPDVKLL